MLPEPVNPPAQKEMCTFSEWALKERGQGVINSSQT